MPNSTHNLPKSAPMGGDSASLTPVLEAENGDLPQNAPECPTPQNESENPRPEALLSHRQRVVLRLILQGLTDLDITRAISIDRKTVYRWRTQDPDFRAALEYHLRRQFEFDQNRLANLNEKALDRLESQINHPNPAVARSAARTVLVLSRIGNQLEKEMSENPLINPRDDERD